MSESEVIDVGERAVTVREQTAPALLGSDPDEVLERATKVANTLAPMIRKQELFKNIGGKEHVLVEGWTTLGAMLKVYPVLVGEPEWSEGRTAVRAIVEARTLEGYVVGRASAMCSREERNWSNRDDYALESMAQTRATSKAMRMPLGWIMQLAGYQPTPAEEMDGVRDSGPFDSRASDRPAPRSEPESAFDTPIGFGKHKDKTWRWLSEGSVGGERHQYVDWLAKKAEKASPTVRERAKMVLALYEKREAQQHEGQQEGAF